MRKPTVLQINAVALSVALGGSYVYYRAAQEQQQRDQVMTSSKMRPLTAQRLAATTATMANSSCASKNASGIASGSTSARFARRWALENSCRA